MVGKLFMKLNVRALKKKRHLLVFIPVIFITILLVILQVRSGSSSIGTYTAHRGDFVINIDERGEIDAVSKISVSVPDNIYGDVRITKLVADGIRVEKGDFLIQFDTSNIEQSVKNSQEELDNAKADQSSIQARIESYRKELEKNLKTEEYSCEQSKLRFETMKYEAEEKKREAELNLKKSELSLQQAKRRIESQKIIDKADIAKAEVRVKRSELRYNLAVDQLNALTIRSPKSGIVVLQEIFDRSSNTRLKIKVGDTPHRRMELVSIPDPSKMIVKTQINEVDITKIKTGQEIILTLDAIPGAKYYGTITYVAILAHRQEGSDNKVFDIEATINNTDESIKPGMSAQCTIIIERITDQLFIPIDSVFEKEGTTVVYVKDSGFKARTVKVGRQNSNYIIIEDGLKEDEEVALRDPTLQLEEIGSSKSVTVSNIDKSNN